MGGLKGWQTARPGMGGGGCYVSMRGGDDGG